MSAEENAAIVRRWVDIWHSHNVAAVADFVTADYVRHDPNLPEVRGPQAEQDLMTAFLTALPDLRFTVDDLVAHEDKVVARYTCRGTQRGELLGVPPTNQPISISAVEIYRLVDGKIAEQWVIMDALGLMQQLGVIPRSEPA